MEPLARRLVIAGIMNNPTLRQVFEALFARKWKTKKTAHEIRRLYFRVLDPRFGYKGVRDIRDEDIALFHAEGAAQPYQTNRAFTYLSALFDFAERKGWRDRGSNPSRDFARYPELTRPRFASAVELARLGPIMEKAARDPRRLPAIVAIYLTLLSGARPSEIAAARTEWVVNGVLNMPDAKTGSRPVYLPPEALLLLERLPEGREFLTGVTAKGAAAAWRNLRREAGIPDLRLYDLRRTFGTIGMAVTKNRGLIGEMLGHRDEQTTKTYARIWNEAAVEGVAQTGAAISNLLGGNLVDLLRGAHGAKAEHTE